MWVQKLKKKTYIDKSMQYNIFHQHMDAREMGLLYGHGLAKSTPGVIGFGSPSATRAILVEGIWMNNDEYDMEYGGYSWIFSISGMVIDRFMVSVWPGARDVGHMDAPRCATKPGRQKRVGVLKQGCLNIITQPGEGSSDIMGT